MSKQDDPTPPGGTTRRDFGRHVLGGLTAAALVACGKDGAGAAGADATAGGGDLPDATPPPDAGPGTPDGGACTLYPQQTEGPFYLDLASLRRDITEGKPGTPMRLTIKVLAAAGCAPIKDAAVDVWHCDVGGVYSGFPGQLGGVNTTGQTFLRGTQVTGDGGEAVFDTIYPGWYPGRTTHIHFKVHLAANREATSQLYFPEDANAAVYATPPYDTRGQKDTANSQDGIAGSAPVVSVAGNAAGYVATLTVTVAG